MRAIVLFFSIVRCMWIAVCWCVRVPVRHGAPAADDAIGARRGRRALSRHAALLAAHVPRGGHPRPLSRHSGEPDALCRLSAHPRAVRRAPVLLRAGREPPPPLVHVHCA